MRIYRAPSRNDVPVSSLFRFFVPTVDLRADRDAFTWRRKERELTLATVVYFDAERRQPLSAGEPPAEMNGVAVNLFPAAPDGNDDVRQDALEYFCGFSLYALSASPVGGMRHWRIRIKPHVRVAASSQLRAALHGYEMPVLADALIRAGAAAVMSLARQVVRVL